MFTARNIIVLAACVTACSGSGARYASGPSCEERKTQLLSVLGSLPDETLNAPLDIPLPSASLAGGFGAGSVLELHGNQALFNGKPVPGTSEAERTSALRSLVPPAPHVGAPLYAAASANVDIRTLQAYLAALPDSYALRLTFGRPEAPPSTNNGEPDEATEDTAYAEKLLLERDPVTRRNIAEEGYQEYSDCQAIDAAVAAQRSATEAARWPALKRSMLEAVPRCKCADINPDGLRNLLVAEQRAGNVAVGSMPASFLKDIRCKASMPLRTVQQVLADVENFEAEFSGNWDDSGVRFEEVVTNERLLNYLCTAMAGEVFESVSAEFATVYVKTTKAPKCRGYRLEPVARGAVFGTLRSLDTPPPGTHESSFHYRLGGNDIRIFGPVPDATSRATDDGPWACNKDLKLTLADSESLAIEGGGRFYLSESACERSRAQEAMFASCVFDPNLAPLVAPAADSPAPQPPSAEPSL